MGTLWIKMWEVVISRWQGRATLCDGSLLSFFSVLKFSMMRACLVWQGMTQARWAPNIWLMLRWGGGRVWFGFSFCVFLVSKSRTHEIAKNDLEFRIFFLNRRDYRHVPSVPVLCNAEDQTWGFSVLRKRSASWAPAPESCPSPQVSKARYYSTHL